MMPNALFEEQVVVVTGASRGLGRAYAMALANAGARVVVNDLPQEAAALDALVAQIQAAGAQACANHDDLLRHPAGPVDTALARYGRLDAVINNAGATGGGTVAQMPVEAFDRLMAVNVGASVGVLRAAWPVFERQRYGRIVNTASGSVLGLPGCFAYQTSKAAVIGLTRALAQDGAALGIRVNAVSPIAHTRMTADIPDAAFVDFLRQHFPPEAVAPFVLALASREVPCSGELFSVGGGMAARVTLGIVPGAVLGAAASPGAWLSRFDEVMDLAGQQIPPHAMAEVAFRAQQIGAALQAAGGAPDWSRT
jgi:NAD(P)-dependent dehydrogenase (short-subunit alcohol dehydrogenase family)